MLRAKITRFCVNYIYTVPVTRPRQETTEERRERKRAVKEERKVRCLPLNRKQRVKISLFLVPSV